MNMIGFIHNRERREILRALYAGNLEKMVKRMLEYISDYTGKRRIPPESVELFCPGNNSLQRNDDHSSQIVGFTTAEICRVCREFVGLPMRMRRGNDSYFCPCNQLMLHFKELHGGHLRWGEEQTGYKRVLLRAHMAVENYYHELEMEETRSWPEL